MKWLLLISMIFVNLVHALDDDSYQKEWAAGIRYYTTYQEDDMPSEFMFGMPHAPRYIKKDIEIERAYEMSDNTFVFKINGHFYRSENLIHVKDCVAGCKFKNYSKNNEYEMGN